MLEISTNTQIGVGLASLGLTFIFLGIVLLFDKGLLAIGNLLFLAGLCFIIGFRKTFSFFIQWNRLKGSAAFFTGIFVLLLGHPIIGVVIELIGFYLLFRGFLPTVFQYITSFVPFFGSSIRNKSIV